jgi:hypothetical protein
LADGLKSQLIGVDRGCARARRAEDKSGVNKFRNWPGSITNDSFAQQSAKRSHQPEGGLGEPHRPAGTAGV